MIKTRIKDKSIIAISDTHGFHKDLKIRYRDIPICCGDIWTDGNEEDIEDFFKWFTFCWRQTGKILKLETNRVGVELSRAIKDLNKIIAFEENTFIHS